MAEDVPFHVPLDRITWLDFETQRFAPGYRAPCPAIATTYHASAGAKLWYTHQLAQLLEAILQDCVHGDGYLGGHDIARYDCPIIAEWFPWLRPLLWAAFERGRIVDTLTCERILQIQRGEPGELALDACARHHGVPMPPKDDAVQAIRISFGQFIGATALPPAHAAYALEDAIVLPRIYERQVASKLVDQYDVAELARQTFALALVSARGFRTDVERVRELETMVNAKLAALEEIARDYGFLKTKPDGTVGQNKTAIQYAIACDYAGVPYSPVEGKSKAAAHRNLKAALAAVLAGPGGGAVPRTAKDGVKTDRLTKTDANDPGLQALAEWDQMCSIKNKDLQIFYRGASEPIHPRFGIADTTRSISADPNCQNFAKARGVRECIRARPGYALAVSDFKMVELVGLAQIIVEALGLRTMAQKINDGIDMHAEVGADVLGCTYAEIKARKDAGDHEAEEARDSGKPANFGCNGAMSDPKTFALYARKSYGQDLVKRLPGESVDTWNLRRYERAAQIMQAWRGRAVDQQAYIAAVRRGKNALGLYDMKHPRMRSLYRRGLRLTEACNNPFQIFGMRIAARALWLVLKAQYCTGEMAGSHVVLFVHDDISSEVPLHLAHEHAMIQDRLMAQASREIAPDVFAGVDTKVLTHLSKTAKASRDADGHLQVTEVSMPSKIGR